MNIVIVIAALMSVTASATPNDTEPSYGRVPADEVIIEMGNGFGVAVDSVSGAPVVLAPSMGSPDQPEHYLELELVIAHAEFDYELALNFARINRRSYEHVRGRTPDLWRREIRMPSSGGDFLPTLRKLLSLPPVVLSDIFTDEIAALFLSRLQMEARFSPDVVLDLFTKIGIGRIPSVARLIPGWVVSITSDAVSRIEFATEEALDNIVQLVPEGGGLTPGASIPRDILQQIQQHLDNTPGQEILADLPGRLGEIDNSYRFHTRARVSKFLAEPSFRSRLNLVKDFYFLGVPFCLWKLKLVEITILELQAILPFVSGAEHALRYQITELIEMKRFDVIIAIIKCDNFRFGNSLSIYKIILALIDIESQHGLLRTLLQTPFRDGALKEVASIISPIPILHKAVRVRNDAAVRDLLSIEGLINLNLLDRHGRTALDYAVDDGDRRTRPRWRGLPRRFRRSDSHPLRVPGS